MAEGVAAKAVSKSPEKKQDKPAIAELKNGKVIFRQKPMLLEKLSETLQEIVKFREMIERQESPLQCLPDEYLPLVAKLGHESDKTLTALAKHIQQELIPPQEDDEEDTKVPPAKSILPLQAVEQAIKLTLERNNYGIEVFNGSRPPAAISVWRWEVQHNHKDWLPKSAREKLEARLSERVQAKESLKQIFGALSQPEKDAILDPKGTNRAVVKDASEKMPEPLPIKSDNEKAGTPVRSTPTQDEEIIRSATASGSGRPRKPKDPEKDVKEKERQEKRAAKVEKEQKVKDSQNKSRALMANFFTKPKAQPTLKAREGESVPGPSRTQNDFERTFKPFVLKKGSVLAPVNWFKAPKKRRRKGTATTRDLGTIVIVSDDESERNSAGPEMQISRTAPVDIGRMAAQERLRNVLVSLYPPSDCSRPPPSRRKRPDSQFQIHHPYSIRDCISKLSEAEVSGDDKEVRTLLNQLQDRELFPAKVFIYHEDARPGYFGTWTRSSKFIGPRRPFSKDVVEFDYGYDSGEEWEAEPMGEADDVLQDDDEEGGSDEADSDIDSWLVDDDEEPEIMSDHFRDSSSPMFLDFPDMPPPPTILKRKAPEMDKKAKKRKVVIPLVPFSKGPCWEAKLGECEYEPFNQYRIQLFNDTPFPIDPFTFVSTCVEDYKASLKTSTPAAGARDSNPNAPLLAPIHGNALSTVSLSKVATAPNIKKTAAALKNPFPDNHLPFLLGKISELQMPSFVVLVETIYQELKAHKVKKIAIEAKIREVGEKCKEKKVWIVKPTLKAQLMPP